MGQKSSRLKVYSRLCLTEECETIDCISLSYGSSSGCGNNCSGQQKQVMVACFCYDRAEGLNTLGVRRYSSSKSASVNVKKLRKKEGNIPVRVTCLEEGVPVLETELELCDLLKRLQLPKRGGKSALMFGVSPRSNKLEGEEQKSYKLFCNGRLIVGPGGGSAHSQDVNIQQLDEGGDNNENIETLHEKVTPPKKGDLGSKVTLVESSDPGTKFTPVERIDPDMEVVKPVDLNDHQSHDVTPATETLPNSDNDSMVTSDQQDDKDKAAIITPDNYVKEKPNMITSHDYQNNDNNNTDNVTTLDNYTKKELETCRDSPHCYYKHKEENNKQDTRDFSSSSFLDELNKEFGGVNKGQNSGQERPNNVPQDLNSLPTSSSDTETETETETESGSEYNGDGGSPAVLEVMPPVEWTFTTMKTVANPLDEYVTDVIKTYKNPQESIAEEEALRLLQKQTPATASHNRRGRNNYNKYKTKTLLSCAVKCIAPVMLCLSIYNAWVEYNDYITYNKYN